MTLREMDRKMSFRDVANAVRADAGAFNWYLVRGDANGASEVFNAGGGSLDEMKKSLASDEVFFGLLRMGFGRGAFRRVKHIFIHWSGADVNPLKRGQHNANEEAIRKLVGPVNLSHFATEMDEMNLNDLLDKVKTKVVLDGEAIDDVEDLFSLESYMVSCEDDAEAMKREFPDAIREGDGEEDEQPLTPRQLRVIFEQEVALPDRLPDPEPSCSDADFVDQFHARNRRDLARGKIWIEWLDEQLAVLGVEEYDPAPIPYCQRSPCYEGPGFEVPLSDLDSDSDSDAD